MHKYFNDIVPGVKSLSVEEFKSLSGVIPHPSIVRGLLIGVAYLAVCGKHEPKLSNYGVEYCEKCKL